MTDMKVLLILVVVVVQNVASHNLWDFYKLPKIYKMENYTNCLSEKNLYCELEFEVKSANNESKFWKLIQNYDAEESFYDRKMLYRAMCLPKLYKNEEIKLKEIGLVKMKNELKSYDLDADLIYFHCKLPFTYKLRDYIILCFLILYFGWIIIATSVDHFTNNLINKYLQYFSIIYNYKILTKTNKSPHYNRLKFMQGVRLYCTIFVVVTHSVLTYVSVYSENPEFFEEIYSYKIIVFFGYFFSLLVPTFFMLSSWLSILEIDIMSKTFSEFPIRHVLLLLVNRLLRYAPILVFMYCLNSNIIFKNDIPCTKVVDRFIFNCRFGWLYILIQNWFYTSETCNPHFWSLSVDIQGYIILLAASYIIIKHKLPIIRSLLMLSLFFIIIQIIIMYYYNLNTFFKFTARNSLPISKKNLEANLSYFSTIPNLPSYLIGSIFGILYLRNIDNGIFENKILKTILLSTSIAFVASAINFTDIPQSRLAKSVFGSLLKPIYVTGVAVFLFGLAQNVADKLRKIFEIRVVEILGKCTLSIYVIHIPICFLHGFGNDSETKLVFHQLVFAIIGDVVKSFLAGFLLYLTVEQPFAMLIRFDYKEGKKIFEKRNNFRKK